MKTETKEVLGFEVPIVGIAETLAEAVTAAGSEAEVLKDFNNNVLFHSHLGILRKKIVKLLVTLTGIPLKTKTEGTKVVVDETDGTYLARLEVEQPDFRAKYGDDVIKACEAVKVDYTPGTRGSGDGDKPAKKWLDYVAQMRLENKLDGYVAKFELNIEGKTEEEVNVIMANEVKKRVTASMAAAAKAALA